MICRLVATKDFCVSDAEGARRAVRQCVSSAVRKAAGARTRGREPTGERYRPAPRFSRRTPEQNDPAGYSGTAQRYE